MNLQQGSDWVVESLDGREDEVVLCQFDGTPETVRAVAERAQVPFERILQAARSPWASGLRS